MLGFIPAWALWLSGGWAAKTVAEKMKPPVAGAPQRGAYPSGPVAPQPPPQEQQHAAPQGPPPPRPGPACQFDPHMDVRTERAVVKYLTEGDPVKLRGFADSVTTNLPPQYYPRGYFPMAAFAMRMQAQMIEAQRAQAAKTPPPPPAPVAAPSPKANGAAVAPVTIEVAPEVTAQPES